MRTLPEYEIVNRAGANPIVLMGSPGRLKGEIALSNPGERRVVVKGAHITRLPEAIEVRHASRSHLAAHLTAILRPGQDSRAQIQLRLHPATPPGEYQVELMLGQHSYPAVLHITEEYDLEVSPDPIVIENRPGSRVVKQIVVHNLGNVALKIGSPGPVPLDDELLQCRTIRGALAEGYDKAETWEQWLSVFLRQGKKGLDKAGMLWVQNVEDEVKVEPGEIRPIEFQIRQPDTNDSSSRYSGLAFLYGENLNFSVVPSDYSQKAHRTPKEETIEISIEQPQQRRARKR